MTERSPAEILGEIALARTEAWDEFWRRVYIVTPTGRNTPSEPEMQEIIQRGVPIMIVDYETDGYDFGIADKMVPIQPDFASLEERVIALHITERNLDVMLEPKLCAEDIKPAKSYLRHDPTKNHRKVRRK